MTVARRTPSRPAMAVVRALIRLYPGDFRTRFGPEMEQFVRDAVSDGGGVPWRWILPDLIAGAIRERISARRHRRALPVSPHAHHRDRMGTLLQDLRYATRTLRRNPGFALVVVVSLAIGIGANSLIYSVVDGLVLRPFPYPAPDRLVAIAATFPKADGERRFIEAISPPEYEDIRNGSSTIERFFAFDLGNRNISGGDRPERVFTAFVWGEPMATIGVQPLLGRGFRVEETVAPGPPVALLSHRIWQSRFGSDSSIVGRVIQVNGTPTQVVGIMPPGFLLAGTDLWLPVATAPSNVPRTARQFAVVGRLRDGATLARANAELAAIAGRTERAHVAELKEYAGWRLEADTWANAIVGELRPAARILLGAVGLVLLIACANVASLLLARAASRRRELGVRRALGAGRARLARQLLTEAALLALLGAAAGLAIAYALVGPTASLFPERVRSVGLEASINGRVLLYTLGAAVLAGLIFGVWPAVQATRGDPREWLSADGGGERLTTSATGRRLRSGFVVAQLALSLMLLAGAGVLVRSFARLQSVDPGFDVSRTLTMRLSLPREKYPRERIGPFFEVLSARLAALPGVQGAGATTQFPPGNVFNARVAVEGDITPASEARTVDVTNVTEGFFRALGYKLRTGRLFTARDDERAPLVAVVNDAAARRLFGGASPIGRRIALGESAPDRPPRWIEIVGVTNDVRNHGLDAPPAPEVFIPVRQQDAAWNNQLFLVVRARSDAAALLPAVRRTLAALDPDQPVYAIRTLDEAFADSIAQRTAAMVLLSIFAAIALVLAAVGVYGLMSYMVNERRHEIGIRMALGAAGRDVLRLVVRETGVLVATGVVLGVAGALALGRALRSLAFEVGASDPATIAAVASLLAIVALAATLAPARRAARVAPVVALRE
jgi:putative ABC transport system permease protein